MVVKIVWIAAALLAALAAGLLVLAATRPDSFRVQRIASVKAPPEAIFPLISDFRRWALWSPWEAKDPAMTRELGGPESGKGAVYAWDGDRTVGAGRMEIADAAPPSRVAIMLDFTRPFEAHNLVEFTLEPQGEATTVTWSMRGPVPYLMRILHLFIDMDRMVGTEFEAGLAKLKAAAEQQPRA